MVVSCRQGNTYLIKREDNFRQRFTRHYDQLKPFEPREDRLVRLPQMDPATRGPGNQERNPNPVPAREELDSDDSEEEVEDDEEDDDDEDGDEDDDEDDPDDYQDAEPMPRIAQAAEPPGVPFRRGTRQRKPPDRFGDWTE